MGSRSLSRSALASECRIPGGFVFLLALPGVLALDLADRDLLKPN